MKLYGFTRSPFTRKVRLVLAEKKIPYEWVEYQNRHKDPQYPIMNPYKTVPILELDSGTFLYESTVINEYLEDAHPEPSLRLRDPEQSAVVRLWEDFADCHLTYTLLGVVRDRVQFTPEGPKPRDPATVDPAAAKEHRIALDTELDRLEKHLVERDYVAGPVRGVFTLADIALVPPLLGTTARLDFSVTEGRTNLSSWIERVKSRSSVKEVIQ